MTPRICGSFVSIIVILNLADQGLSYGSRRSRRSYSRTRSRYDPYYGDNGDEFSSNAISDLNDCPGGWDWYDGHCYYEPKVSPQTFLKAQQVCTRLGGSKVVSINTADEEKFVSSMISSEKHWLGLTNFGSWIWEDGDTSTLKNLSGEGNCAVLEPESPWRFFWPSNGNAAFEWFAEECTSVHPFVCEIHVNETLWMCGPGWVWWGSGCYNISSILATFDEAKDACAVNGTLTNVLTTDENFALSSLLKTSGHAKAWIGLHRSSPEAAWKWLDNNPVTFTNWKGWGPDWSDDAAVGHYYMYTWWWYTSYTFKWLGEKRSYNNKYIYICKKSILDTGNFPIIQEESMQNDKQGAYFKSLNVFNASLTGSDALRLRGKIECAHFCASVETCNSFHYEKKGKLCAISTDPSAPFTYSMTNPFP